MTTVFVEDPPPNLPEWDDVSVEWLHENALWMIMDAWYPHPWPHDVEADPQINERTNEMVGKIVEYLPNLTHYKMSSPQRFPVHPDLEHIENFYNETPDVERADIRVAKYMKEHGLNDIVYMGFHLGRCIVAKESGAKQMSRYGARLWFKEDLVGALITDDYDDVYKKTIEWARPI